VYAAIAVVALVLTWRNSGPYTHSPTAIFADFWRDAKANNATRFIAVDLLWFGFAAAIWMVGEARKHEIRFVWAYILAFFLVDVSVAFPLFLIARELRMKDSEPLGLRTADTVSIVALAGALLALTVWIDR
jgi:hypothetical protein